MEGRSLQRRVSVSRSSNFRNHLKIRDEDEDDNDKETSGAVAHNEEPAAPAVEEEKPQQVSLMALLEQTDRQWAVGGETAAEEREAEEEEEEEVEEEKRGKKRGMYSVCCVCMVRHKGAAFIPCGHTFCRLCSRELWVSRGNCPLCNGFILEILDIF